MQGDRHAETISLTTNMQTPPTVIATQVLRSSQPGIRDEKKDVQKDTSKCFGRAPWQLKQTPLSGHVSFAVKQSISSLENV